MKKFYDQLKHGLKMPHSYHLASIRDDLTVGYFTKNYFAKQHKWYTIQKNYNALQYKKYKLRYKRKDFINKRFEYTEENLLKFEKLSNSLADIQIDILRKHRHISKTSSSDLSLADLKFTRIENDFFYVEYYFTQGNFSTFLYTAHYLLEDIPETDEMEQHWFTHFNKNYSYKESVIDYTKYFSKFRQSKLFYDLIKESDLSLPDILELSEIRYEFKREYITEKKIN